MVYQVGDRRLFVVSSLLQGQVNDVHICCEEGSRSKNYMTLLVIRDRQTARTIVEMTAGKKSHMPYLEAFPWRDQYCLLFEYRSPRPVCEFAVGNPGLEHDAGWEKLALGIVLRCMEESTRSNPFLYLMIRQNQIHLGTDGEIYVTYCLNLEEFDASVEERQCVCACAVYLANLMEESGCKKSPELLLRKAERSAYQNFRELYQDITLIFSPERRSGIISRIRAWGYRRREFGFKLLVVLCFLLAAAALVTLLSQLVTGDVGWFRLLFHTFDQIGTETLR